MKKLNILAFTGMMMLFPVSLFAHSGHGTFQNSLLHYFTSPLHLAELVILCAVIVYFWVRKFSRKAK